MSEVWTIKKVLNWTSDYFSKAGVDSPRLTAEMLLSYVLKLSRIDLYTNFDRVIEKPQLNKLHILIKRTSDHEPVAYLIGRTEFYSLEIEVNKFTLIPRPETELLVERAIELMRDRRGRQYVCDLCTGSGCVGVAIAKNFENCEILATDICDSALQVAAKNVKKHGVEDKVKLLSGDLFDPVLPELDVDKFDLIVSNPPYVSVEEFENLDSNVRVYEPKLALLAGEDGLDIYRRIAEQVDNYLADGGVLMLEIGYAQGSAVKELLEQAGCFEEIKIEKDFQGHDRIVTAFKKGD